MRATGDSVPEQTRAELATLIYYPNEKLLQLKADVQDEEALDRLVHGISLQLLISAGWCLKHASSMCAHCLPSSCGYILDELLHAHFERTTTGTKILQADRGSIIENGRRPVHCPAGGLIGGWLWTAASWVTCLTAAPA